MQQELLIRERWLFMLYYPLAAFGVVLIGNGNSWNELLLIPSFYSDLLLSVVIAYFSGYLLSIWWRKSVFFFRKQRHRILKTFLAGVTIPWFLAIAGEMIYLRWGLGMELSDSSIFTLEGPVSLLLIVIANMFYLTGREKPTAIQDEGEDSPGDLFFVRQHQKIIQIDARQVEFLLFENGVSNLFLDGGKKITLPSPFQEVNRKLPTALFFRINRQLTARKSAIAEVSKAPGRKLKIRLKQQERREFFVPKTRVSQFRQWVEGK